jgi:hypothetical protein
MGAGLRGTGDLVHGDDVARQGASMVVRQIVGIRHEPADRHGLGRVPVQVPNPVLLPLDDGGVAHLVCVNVGTVAGDQVRSGRHID